jgi:hypothetical protein
MMKDLHYRHAALQAGLRQVGQNSMIYLRGNKNGY